MRLAALLLLLLPAAGSAQTPQQCMSQFQPGGARAQCMTPWLDGIVTRKGAAAALEFAEELVKNGKMNVNDCYVMSHAVGHASWRKERDLGRAFRACTQKCIQGCYHGAIEAFMIDAPPAETTPARVRAFCDQLGANSLERRQCLHGLGHGVAYQHRADVQSATSACEALGGRREADLCLGGLWMQRAHFRIHLSTEAYALGAPTMCDGVRADLLPECARAVGGGAMFATGHEPAKSAAICRQLPAAQQRDCQRGVEYEVELIKAGPGRAHSH